MHGFDLGTNLNVFGRTDEVWRPGGLRWREQTRILYSYLRRQMWDSKELRRQLYPVNGDNHVPRNVALLARIVRELATLYLFPPARSFTGLAEPLEDALRKVYTDVEMDASLRYAHEQMIAMGNSTLWLWPDRDRQSVRPLVVSPHEQEVKMRVVTGKRVGDVEWWRIRIPLANDPTLGTTQYGVAHVSATEAYWYQAPGDLQDQGLWSEDRSNPLGRIPVVILRAAPPDIADFWSPVPEDLLDASRAVNHDMTDAGEIGRKQAFGQAVATGISQEQAKDLSVGPETVIALPDADQTFQFASANPDLKGLLESGMEYQRAVIATNGINPATLMRSQGITALAKHIELADRQQERARYASQFERAEQSVYDITTGWLNLMRGQTVYGPSEVVVRYNIPAPPSDPQATAQTLQLEIKMGLTSAARERAKRDGISIAAAELLVLEDMRLTRRLAIEANTLTPEELQRFGLQNASPLVASNALTALSRDDESDPVVRALFANDRP